MFKGGKRVRVVYTHHRVCVRARSRSPPYATLRARVFVRARALPLTVRPSGGAPTARLSRSVQRSVERVSS